MSPNDESVVDVRSGAGVDSGRQVSARARLAWLWKRVPDVVLTWLLVAVAVAALQWVASEKWVTVLILPAPTSIWRAFRAGFVGFGHGTYWGDLIATALGAIIGFAVGVVAAVITAGILTSTERLERVFFPIIAALQTVPKVALAPLALIWLGFGLQGKVLLASTGCFFPILVNVLQGLRLRDRDQVDLMRSLGASRYQLFRYIRIPHAVPYLLAACRIGILFSLVGAVVADFVGSTPGLGYRLLIEEQAFDVSAMYAILVALMIMGLIANGAVRLVESRVVYWGEDVSHTTL